jgi:putative ABC transport system permease protein
VNIASELVNEDYITYCNNAFGKDMLDTNSGKVKATATVLFIDNATYRDYLKKNSLDETVFMNTTTPQAVVIDEVKFYNGKDGKYHTFHMLNSKTADITANRAKKIEGYTLDEVNTDKDGNPVYTFKNAKGETIELPEEKALESMDFHAGAVEDNKPFMAGTNDITSILLLYPYDAIPAVLHMEKDVNEVSFCFQSKAHKATFEKMYSILETKGLSTESLYDFAASVESERAMINVVNVFSYGFIVLISLIAAANVFNTISTNIALRRREFAMLKSIGMTRKGFYKMMNYECLLYGLKGLMYGIPVSIGITYLIFMGISGGLETGFFIPWYSVAVAVGSVFAVVFSTMLYSMRKIQKDNPIDALRNENL